MMRVLLAAATLAVLVAPALAGEGADKTIAAAYEGRLAEERGALAALCDGGDTEACFGAGLAELVHGYQDLSRAMYRHGASVPGSSATELIFGLGLDGQDALQVANPSPEPLTYEQLRVILEDTIAALDKARDYFTVAGDGAEFLVALDPLQVRLDVDGDGVIGDAETFAPFVATVMGGPTGGLSDKQKSKGLDAAGESHIGFDKADALWFAGYTQITATPVDWLLAHDFSGLYAAYFHRIFPKASLPMQEHTMGGTLLIDPGSDSEIADLIAAIHMMRFPVVDRDRLAGVLDRMKQVPEFSRRNWDAILAETDDNRELLPSPSQTSLVPGYSVTQEVVDAWMATLDTVDAVLAGELLLPHWRFERGFDLKAYFETAMETDLVMLLAGQGALPFLRDGPVADADSFAEGNRVFGENWPNFAIWFN
jgi:hypothetical protein